MLGSNEKWMVWKVEEGKWKIEIEKRKIEIDKWS
jgi:hypothetical protein